VALVVCDLRRVAERAEEVAAQEAVPWDGRNPATVACALVYGVLQIAKVGAVSSS